MCIIITYFSTYRVMEILKKHVIFISYINNSPMRLNFRKKEWSPSENIQPAFPLNKFLYNCSKNHSIRTLKINKIPYFINYVSSEQISYVTLKKNRVNVSQCPYNPISIVHWPTMKYEKC